MARARGEGFPRRQERVGGGERVFWGFIGSGSKVPKSRQDT